MKSALIIVGSPEHFGYGHLNRMRLLAFELKRHKWSSQIICTDDDEIVRAQIDFNILLLDRRDTSFPNISPKPSFDFHRVTIDNRGDSRNNSDATFDILPHPDQSEIEFFLSLRRLILHDAIAERPSAAHQATIQLIEPPDTVVADFSQSPVSTNEGLLRLSSNEYIRKIDEAKTVRCYYGQTFFEALYLGKHIYLECISDYHKKLSATFIERTKLYPRWLEYFDGKGTQHLAREIIALTEA